MCSLNFLLAAAAEAPIPSPAAPATSVTAAGGAALYTLLGVAITAVVSLAAVYVKYKLDSKAETRKYQQELVKLQLQLSEERIDRSKNEVRKVFAELLAGTAAIYRTIREARRQRRDDGDDTAYQATLRGISPDQCQVALEEGSLISNADTVVAAERLWHHLRSHPVPGGRDLSSTAWSLWKEEYWQLRRDLVERLRVVISSGPGPTAHAEALPSELAGDR